MLGCQNLFLSAMPRELYGSLAPHLHLRQLPSGTTIADTDRETTEVFFPYNCAISLVVELENGNVIETAMIGRDGVANATQSMDGKRSINRAVVQVAGSAAVIKADSLRRLTDASSELRSLLIRHEQILLAQAQQAAACNATHHIQARLCKWLLRVRKLTMSPQFHVTQEFLAQMMGVRRTSVSLIASSLQRDGIIQYSRGALRILSEEKLEESACECYRTMEAWHESLCSPSPEAREMGRRADEGR